MKIFLFVVALLCAGFSASAQSVGGSISNSAAGSVTVPMPFVLNQGQASLFLDGRTDVAYAYSMDRRLRTAYVGALFNLRRASDNTAQDFGSGQNVLIQSGPAAFCAATTCYVTTIYDQSGNGYDLTQVVASSQPVYGVLSNGLPGMTFNGSSDQLTATFTLNQPMSLAIVYRRVSFSGTAYVFGSIDGGTGTFTYLYFSSGTDNQIAAGQYGLASDSGTSMPGGTRGAVGGTINSTSSLLAINAATVANFSGNAGTDTLVNPVLGSAGYYGYANVEVQELIGFNTAHSLGNSTTPGTLQGDNASMRSWWNF